MDRKIIIAAGIEAGYFRAKDVDKKALLAQDIVQALIGNGQNPLADALQEREILETLEAETIARHLENQQRIARKLARDEANAAKPLKGGTTDPSSLLKRGYGPGRYLVSVAQNNTEVNDDFLGSMLQYAREHDAQLLVAKTTYNKNAFSQIPTEEGVYYCDKIKPYLVEGTLELCPTLHFLADANVIVTSRGNPLSGFEGATPPGVSAIVGTSSIQLVCTPALKGQKGKVLFGTGAVTLPNYIMRKAGAVATATHSIAALLVIVQADLTWEARQIEQMPGTAGFIDEGEWYVPLDMPITAGIVPACWQFGDIHAEKLPAKSLRNMLEVLEKYQPQALAVHDLLDMSSRNHHNIKSPTFIFQQQEKGNTVYKDLLQVCDVLQLFAHAVPEADIIVIESNHDLALSKWLDTTQPKDDPVNAVTWLKCTLAQYEAIQRNDEGFHPLAWACYNLCGLDITARFHGSDESIMIAGVEMGNHGHSGANGAKGGGARGFAKLGVRTNTGHTHTPGISNGLAYVAGVAAGNIDMGYNVGPSSWRAASICTWPNGARQIIFHD